MSNAHRKPWNAEEEEALSEIVHALGQRWTEVAAALSALGLGVTRTTKQCRERWTNHLDPTLNSGKWTLEEAQNLFKHHQVYGNQWMTIAGLMPGRSDNAIKNFFNMTLKKALKHYNQKARGGARILRTMKSLVRDKNITVVLRSSLLAVVKPGRYPLPSIAEALFTDPSEWHNWSGWPRLDLWLPGAWQLPQ